MRRMTVLIALPLLTFAGCVEEPPDLETAEHQIVGGGPTSQYPAVPELYITNSTGEGGLCSGTLISPRVVLTAAHCLDFGSGQVDGGYAYFGTTTLGADSNFIERLDIVDSTYKTNWSLSGHDVGLVLLERESTVTPLPYNTTVLNNSYINDPLKLVGWGDTYGDAGDAGAKRMVTSYLQGFQSSLVMNYGTSNANTCQGDSGGPGFMTVGNTEVVVGITSWGIQGCLGQSGSTRVAQEASWIASWVSTHDIRVPPTVSITAPAQSATVGSFFVVQATATDDIEVSSVELYLNGAKSATLFGGPYIFNAQGLPSGQARVEVRAYDNSGEMGSDEITVNVDNACMNNDDCPSETACDNGQCLPITGGLGDDCIADDDCLSGLCGMVGGDQYCTQLCNIDVPDCPSDFDCVGAGNGQGACVRADGGGETGGCSAGGGGAGFGWIAMLMAIGLVARRRRRTR